MLSVGHGRAPARPLPSIFICVHHTRLSDFSAFLVSEIAVRSEWDVRLGSRTWARFKLISDEFQRRCEMNDEMAPSHANSFFYLFSVVTDCN